MLNKTLLNRHSRKITAMPISTNNMVPITERAFNIKTSSYKNSFFEKKLET